MKPWAPVPGYRSERRANSRAAHAVMSVPESYASPRPSSTTPSSDPGPAPGTANTLNRSAMGWPSARRTLGWRAASPKASDCTRSTPFAGISTTAVRCCIGQRFDPLQGMSVDTVGSSIKNTLEWAKPAGSASTMSSGGDQLSSKKVAITAARPMTAASTIVATMMDQRAARSGTRRASRPPSHRPLTNATSMINTMATKIAIAKPFNPSPPMAVLRVVTADGASIARCGVATSRPSVERATEKAGGAKRWAALLLALSCVTGVWADVLADRMHRLTQDLRCLVCQNESLADSHAPLAMDLKREIRSKMEQGQSDAQIRDFLQQRYGDFVNYKPPLKASTLLLWGAPLMLLAAGGFVVWRVVRARVAREQGLVEGDEL